MKIQYKLSTLSHSHKYWWKASYNDGKGRIFIDDRSFDTSVLGYVLGIVVPVYEGQKVIGILKCNINIMGPLKHIIDQFSERGRGKMKIARTKGLIVIVGLLLAFLIILSSLVWGKLLTSPLVRLANAARRIGQGDLETQVVEKNGDEISELTHSLNEMAANLKTTMASRQELIQEVKLHIQTEKELELLASTDDLTGLYNRRTFSDHMENEVARANRYDTPFCLLMFDIDYFKKINDTYGHEVGDSVLAKMAHLVKDTMRDQDVIARWGGEEFMILLPQTEETGGLQIAERLRQAIEIHDFGQSKKNYLGLEAW